MCAYCYCKKGILAGAMGGNTPTLKKCFKDKYNALDVFKKELMANFSEIQKCGLFFTFTSDPFLKETILLNDSAIRICLRNNIPVKILTKRADFLGGYMVDGITFTFVDIIKYYSKYKNLIAFGFTLTGHDDLEPSASTNAERIEAMKKLHDAGFKTWASIEPIIDFVSSLQMIRESRHFCNLFKIGIESGKKYDKDLIVLFINQSIKMLTNYNCKIYFKDSLLKQAGIKREDLPANCVDRDYNLFSE